MPVANLAYQRKLTRAFINANPVSLVLTPRAKEKKPAGGWTWVDGEPREAQIMSLVEQPGEPRPQVTVDGIDREVEFMLVGSHDALMSIGDTYSHQGKEWEVVEMFYDNGYEKRAMVSARG